MTGCKVKVCGIRDMAAAKAVAQGADYMGFIMSQRFWRYVEPDVVRDICQQVPQCAKVGVFVDEPVEQVAELAGYCLLDFVQLHGHEDEEYAMALRQALQAKSLQTGIIKAFRYGEDFSLETANGYPADMVLIDSYSKNAEGGNGIAFAWHQAAEEIRKVQKPYLIAGGINSSNVREAMDIFQPYGVDVSSALEQGRQKQAGLIREFLQEAGKL